MKGNKNLSDVLPYFAYRFLVNRLCKPFIWANKQKKQTVLTRAIRAVWRAL